MKKLSFSLFKCTKTIGLLLIYLLFGQINNVQSQIINEGFEEADWSALPNSSSGAIAITATSANSTMSYYYNNARSSSAFTTNASISSFFSSSSNAASSTRTSYTVYYTSSGINTSPNYGTWWYSNGTTSSDTKLNKAHSASTSFRLGTSGYLITPVVNNGISSLTLWMAPAGSFFVGVNTNTAATQPTYTSNGTNTLGGFTYYTQSFPGSGTAGYSSMHSFNIPVTFSGPCQVGVFNGSSSGIFLDDLIITSFDTGSLPGLVLNTASSTGQSTGIAAATIASNIPLPSSTIFKSGVIWSTINTPLPDTSLSTKTTNGPAGAGVFSGAINASIAGLTAGTTYFLRAYAATSGGLVYSNVLQFTTAPPVVTTLTTNAATNVNSLSATSGGVIVIDGGAAITAKGVCWNTATNPTIANNLTTNGSGNAPYTSLLAILAPNTTYFARAYATNSIGTAYGNEITFTTPASSPTLLALPNTLAFGDVTVNTNSLAQSFSLTGASLTPAAGNIVLNAPAHYQISLSINGPFGASVSLPYASGTLATTNVFMRFSPTVFGTLNATLPISGGGAPAIGVALTGKGVQSPNDFSNKGTDFWVGYANHEDMYSNATTINSNGGPQKMNLYFTAEQDAIVNLNIPGLSYTAPPITVLANTVTTFQLPNIISSQYAQLYQEGKFNKGIHITSDVPIVSYAHIYSNYVSAATLLLPTTTWGTEYNTFNWTQNSSQNSTSFNFFFVIAKEDNTAIEITPSYNSVGGLIAGNVFTVILNKGEVYNVLGSQGSDFTGSKVKSIDCNKKIAVFSGSGRTDLAPCSGTSSDNLFQQAIPKTAWGTKYLTSRTEGTVRNNIYRIGVSDITTIVSVNGASLPSSTYPATLQNNFYYEVEDSIPLVITADKPITVAQYIKSSNGCINPEPTANFGRFNGDPEMIFISPVEQAINKAILYSSANQDIVFHFINVIIPTSGVANFTLDGVNMASKFKPHTDPSFSYATLDSLNGNILLAGQHIIQSAQPFNAIAYGYGDNNSRNSDPPRESYGYNAGTQLRDLTQTLYVQNPYAISTDGKTCKDVDFKFRVTLPYATGNINSLVWNFNNNPNLLPSNSNVTQVAPTADSSFIVSGKTAYVYSIPTLYKFNATGVYTVKVTANVTDLTGCSGAKDYIFDITVVDGVIANFTNNKNFRICLGDSTRFVDASNGQGFPLVKWQWNFGNSTIDSVANPVRYLPTVGNYNVTLRSINSLGCYADVTKTVEVLALPTSNFTSNTPVCLATPITFNSSTATGGGGSINAWQWSFGDNSNATTQNPSKTYAIANTYTVKLLVTTADGCKDSVTKAVTVLPILAAPVVTSSNITANSIQFNWLAITGASGYQVSVDGGAYITPSSGSTGLLHVVNGLIPNQTVNISVRALGTLACQNATGIGTAKTLLPDVGIFVPNTFTPNADGKNDVLKVYGNYIAKMNLQVYNQWGERVFETNDIAGGWDGNYKGKPQPVGVYIYVLRVENNNGEVVTKKGSINLIR
mgnify:FL=1